MYKKTPIVSIILPTYNGREDRIKKSIDSVLSQSFKEFELIILNDASTNGVEKTILGYKDDRIVYVKNEKNLKLTNTLNKGISLSKGKYIARIDDDDIRIDSDKLKRQVEFLESHEDYGLVGTNAILVDENGEKQYFRERPVTDKELRENMLVGCRIIHSSVVIRKALLHKVGGYDPNRNLVEDYELWMRLGLISKIMNFPDSMVHFRVNNSGVSLGNHRKQKWMALKLFFKYMKKYPKTHIFKAFAVHIGEFLIPPQLIKFCLKKIGNLKAL